MKRRLTSSKILIVTAAIVAAVLLLLGLTLPSKSRRLGPAGHDWNTNVIRGVFHVHSRISDGSGTVDEIAAVAASIGLDFIILTDHGDGTLGTRSSYRDGVLVIEGVEISTDGGHYIALGLPPAPYPLGGDQKGVVEDVRRLGGFGVVAHPESANETLAWTDWDSPVSGVEWINGDNQWRDNGVLTLIGVFARYWLRPTESLASLLSRPVRGLGAWDAVTRERPVVGIAGTDAHAQLIPGFTENEETDGLEFRFPSYESMFQALGVRVELREALSGNARRDTTQLIAQLSAGQSFVAVDAIAEPALFSYTGTLSDGRTVDMGESVLPGQSLTLSANLSTPTETTLRLLKNGETISEVQGNQLTYFSPTNLEPAAYRVEVYLPDSPGQPTMPWIVSNPIYIGGDHSEVTDFRQASLLSPRFLDVMRWRIEKSSDAEAVMRTAENKFSLEYKLGETNETYVAAAYDVEPRVVEINDVVEFGVWASQPTRLSLQLRQGSEEDELRWRRSVYADLTPRMVRVPVGEFQSISADLEKQQAVASIAGVLFVIDRVNSMPQVSGIVKISEPKIGSKDAN